jgi:hypothetical protein
MSDDIDRANDYAELERQSALKNRTHAEIEAGHSGECEQCEEWAQRIVNGLCVKCRNIIEAKHRRR